MKELRQNRLEKEHFLALCSVFIIYLNASLDSLALMYILKDIEVTVILYILIVVLLFRS